MAKPPANRLGMFTDVREILDAALASNGGEYTLPSHGAAVHWRQRAYRFRKAYAEIYGVKAESRYDQLTFPRIEPDSSTVIIKLIRKVGTFTPNEEVVEDKLEIPDDDALLEFAKNLKGDDE